MRHLMQLCILLTLIVPNCFAMNSGGIPECPHQNLDKSLAEFRKTYTSYLAFKKQALHYQPSEWDLRTVSFMDAISSKIEKVQEANVYLHSNQSCGIKCYLEVFLPKKCYRFVTRVTRNCNLNRTYILSYRNTDINNILFAILKSGYSFKCLNLSKDKLREMFDFLKMQKQLAPKDRMLETWTKIYLAEGGSHMRIVMNEENGKYVRVTRNFLFNGWRVTRFNPIMYCWETLTIDDKGRLLSVEKDENGDLVLKHRPLL